MASDQPYTQLEYLHHLSPSPCHLFPQNFTTLMLRLRSLPDWIRLSQRVQKQLHPWHTYTHKDHSDDTDLVSEGSQANKNLPTRPRTSTLVASDVVLFPCVELQRFLSQIDTLPYFITFIFLSSAIDLSEKAFSTPISPPWQTVNPNSIQTPIITFSSGFPLLTPFFSSPFTFFLLPLFFLLLSDFSLSFSLKLLQAISRK